jgi:hypothetical protein
MNVQIPEAQRIPKQDEPKKSTSKCLIIKLSKAKAKKILRATRDERLFTHKGNYIRLYP